MLFLQSCISDSSRRYKGNTSHETRRNNRRHITKDKESIKIVDNRPKIVSTPRITEKKKSSSRKVLKKEDIFRTCNPAVFTVIAPQINSNSCSQGSGFFITQDGLAITNHHVIDNSRLSELFITLSNGMKIHIDRILYDSKEEDICVLKVDVSTSVEYLKIAPNDPCIGSEVYAIGSPKGLKNTFSSGEISQIRDNYTLQINVPIDHGSSGGALINKFGEVVGITSSGFDTSVANLNFAISIQILRNCSALKTYFLNK